MGTYTREKMIELLIRHFKSENFDCRSYSDSWEEIRVPLHCSKEHNGEREEIVVDIIIDKAISKAAMFPNWAEKGMTIVGASSVRFFQYYMPYAKVFWAYGHYVPKKDKNFQEFKKACEDFGIGLLRVADKKVEMIQDATSLNEIFAKRLADKINEIDERQPWKNELIQTSSQLIEEHHEDYIHNLVLYGAPQFRRRQITGRGTGDLSILLISKLEDVQHIAYGQQLKELAFNYRQRVQDDHKIALETIKSLWRLRFEIDYPDIQKDFEVVLLLDPKYRDHFLHQFQVFMLGALIIDRFYNTVWARQFENSFHSKLEDAWLAASTYHDFNYPIEKWDGWMMSFLEQNLHVSDSSGKYHIRQEDLKKEIVQLNLGEVVVRDEFLSKMGRLCGAIGCAFDDRFQRFILRRVAIDKNHAVIGALTFLEKFKEGRKLSEEAAAQAAASILLHDEPNWQCLSGNMPGLLACIDRHECTHEENESCANPLLHQLELKSNPLPFLLIFCDTAQEWGRRGKGYTEEPLLEDIQIDQQKVLIHISLRDHKGFVMKREELERVQQFLKADKFTIKIKSRSGGSTVIPMTGR